MRSALGSLSLRIMLQLQAPVVRTIVGTDSHSGWLPLGAALPLPAPPEEAWIDVRVAVVDNEVELAWLPHDPAHSILSSAQGSRHFPNLRAALGAADTLFGLGQEDWLMRPVDRPLVADDVLALRSAVFKAHGVDDPHAHGWGEATVPPTQERFTVPGGEDALLWLVLDGGRDGLSVFYDPESGDSGLATRDEVGALTYIGDYGSLWATLQSM